LSCAPWRLASDFGRFQYFFDKTKGSPVFCAELCSRFIFDDKWHNIYCFAEREHAERFRRSSAAIGSMLGNVVADRVDEGEATKAEALLGRRGA
jgi:hypothetical protein